MSKKKVAIVVNNTLLFDSRVKRQAKILKEDGYEVRLFARSKGLKVETTKIEDVDCLFVPYKYELGFLCSSWKANLFINYTRIISLFFAIFLSPILLLLFGLRCLIKLFYFICTGLKFSSKVTYFFIKNVAFSMRNIIYSPFSKLFSGSLASGKKLALNTLNYINILIGKIIYTFYLQSITFEESKASLESHIIDFSPDIIHANDLDTLRVAYSAAKKLKIPFIYDSHEFERGRSDRTGIGNKLQIIAEELAYIKKSSAVITVSSGIANLLKETYNLKDVHVIYNSPAINENSRASNIRKDIKISKDKPLLVYVGLITFFRCLEEIVHATKHLRDWHCVFIGPKASDFMPKLNQTIKNLGMSKRVHILSPVSNDKLVNYLKSADVGIIAARSNYRSHDFAMPNKLFEMSFAGMPVVVAPLHDMSKYILENNVGTVLPENFTYKDIAKKVKEAYQKKNRFPNNITKKLIAQYGYDAQAQKLLAIYKNILGKKYNNK